MQQNADIFRLKGVNYKQKKLGGIEIEKDSTRYWHSSFEHVFVWLFKFNEHRFETTHRKKLGWSKGSGLYERSGKDSR